MSLAGLMVGSQVDVNPLLTYASRQYPGQQNNTIFYTSSSMSLGPAVPKRGFAAVTYLNIAGDTDPIDTATIGGSSAEVIYQGIGANNIARNAVFTNLTSSTSGTVTFQMDGASASDDWDAAITIYYSPYVNLKLHSSTQFNVYANEPLVLPHQSSLLFISHQINGNAYPSWNNVIPDYNFDYRTDEFVSIGAYNSSVANSFNIQVSYNDIGILDSLNSAVILSL